MSVKVILAAVSTGAASAASATIHHGQPQQSFASASAAAAEKSAAFLRGIFEGADGGVEVTLMSLVGLTAVYFIVPTAPPTGPENASTPPAAASAIDIAKLFEALQRRNADSGIVDWEMAHTTLESVFLLLMEQQQQGLAEQRQQQERGPPGPPASQRLQPSLSESVSSDASSTATGDSGV